MCSGNASRFEFWKPIDDEDPAPPLAADCVVQWVWTSCFARTECWLCKRNREGLRPLLLAAAIRHIALKAVMHAAKGEVVHAVGPEQFVLGSPSGALSLMWGVEAAATHIGPLGAIFSLDMSSAFGTMGRTWKQRSVRRHASWLVESLLAQIDESRTHHWWQVSTATEHELPAFTGV